MNKPLLFTALILLAFLFLGMLGLPQDPSEQSDTEAKTALQADFDYYLSGMILDSFKPDGSLNYRITADRVTHYPDGDISVLSLPELSWNEAAGHSWLMTAQRGVLRPDTMSSQDSLLLENEVNATQTGQTGNVLTINTDNLMVLPDAREATTETAVLIQRANLRIAGTGMHAWLAQDRIQLLSQVKGQYE